MREQNNKKNPKILIPIVIVLVAAGIFGHFQYNSPYSIAVNDKDLFLVKSRALGEEIIKDVIKDYKNEGGKIVSIEINKDLDIKKKNAWDKNEGLEELNKKKAIKYIEELNEAEDPLFTMTITKTTKGEEEYTPETVYQPDDNMLAGEEVVDVEEASGRRFVTRSITTVNGEVTEEKELKSKILEEGTAKVVRRGTLGLPEGEDWKTYVGDPVYSNEDDLVKLSLKYQGAPYKWGGLNIKTGVSCLGFVKYVYGRMGVNLPNSHKGMRKQGVGVSYKNMRKGDIICYTGHVAIYIGNGKIIHATHGKGVHVSKVYKGQKIVTIRRIVK